MTEYNGPNVYRIMDAHPAAMIEFSGEELSILIQIVNWARGNVPDEAHSRVIADIEGRIHLALQEMRKKFITPNGERRAYAAPDLPAQPVDEPVHEPVEES